MEGCVNNEDDEEKEIATEDKDEGVIHRDNIDNLK